MSVNEYLASQPKALRDVLTRVRQIIRKALPEAEGTISYQIPAYKRHGRAVIYFAGWTEHFSIYPSTDALVDEFGDKLAPHEIARGYDSHTAGDAGSRQVDLRDREVPRAASGRAAQGRKPAAKKR